MSEGLRLIASVLEHGSSSAFRSFDRDMFVGDDELAAFDFVRSHFRNYSELPDHTTVRRDLGVRMPAAPEAVDYYLERVRARSMFNEIRPLYNDLRSLLTNGETDRVRDHIAQMHSACRVHTAEQDLLPLSEVTASVLSHYWENRGRGLMGIPTGWPTLDEETGGYQDGDLVVWAARPSAGKTHLLIHQAKNSWLLGKSVLFVSMEMTLRQIGNRFFAHYAGIDPDCVRKSQLSFWGERRLVAAGEELQSSQRFWLYAGNMGKKTDDLDSVIQEINPDVVYLDGIYLMKPSHRAERKAGDRYTAIAYVLDDLKQITIKRNKPIVCTTQFNRDGAAKPSLETLGYTDALGTHASIVLGVSKPEGDELRPNKRIIEVLKGREGEAVTFATDYKFAPLSFAETSMPVRQDADEDTQSTAGEVERRRQTRFSEPVQDWAGQ